MKFIHLVLLFSIFLVVVSSKTNKKKKPKVRKPFNKIKKGEYNPKKVDWNGVMKKCKDDFVKENRLANFYIRAAAHDALSIVDGFGGADGSLLTLDELKRPENNYDTFGFIVSKSALKLAKKFDASVADIIAVCGALATQFLGGPKIIYNDPQQPFYVGRIDSDIPNPANVLAPKDMNIENFQKFAKDRNFTIEEMTALMGSHVLLDEQRCRLSMNKKTPQIFTWDNTYYRDTCGTTVPGKNVNIRINNPKAPTSMMLPTVGSLKRDEGCKFSNKKNIKKALKEIIRDFDLENKKDNTLVNDEEFKYEDVTFSSVITFPFFGKNRNSTIYHLWRYTIHDAWMGKACMGDVKNIKIANAMNNFKNNITMWNTIYVSAYKKMINLGATWSSHGKMSLSF